MIYLYLKYKGDEYDLNNKYEINILKYNYEYIF